MQCTFKKKTSWVRFICLKKQEGVGSQKQTKKIVFKCCSGSISRYSATSCVQILSQPPCIITSPSESKLCKFPVKARILNMYGLTVSFVGREASKMRIQATINKISESTWLRIVLLYKRSFVLFRWLAAGFHYAVVQHYTVNKASPSQFTIHIRLETAGCTVHSIERMADTRSSVNQKIHYRVYTTAKYLNPVPPPV
jgi:hypothetical protein